MNGNPWWRVFCCLLSVGVLPAARAELVTSRLDLTAGQHQIIVKSAAAGPVEDGSTVSTPGQSATGKTATSGIAFQSLDQYPGSNSFLTTDLFTTRAEAGQSVEQAEANASAVSSLQRSGRWRLIRCDP